MPDVEQYDALILGGGEAGKYTGWHLASQGQRTAVIERRYLGGSCVNIACLPSKNFVQSAKVASFFRHSEAYGCNKPAWSVSMPAVRARKQSMIDDLHEVQRSNFARTGCEYIMGAGRFLDERLLEVSLFNGDIRHLVAERVFINTGSRATIDDTPGLAESLPLTHVEILELDVVPDHLLILGGGYVGLEFAQLMRRLGSRVTVIERNTRLLHTEDPDVSEAITQLLEDEGVELITDAHVQLVSGTSGLRVTLHLTHAGADLVLEGSHLLVATGRTPNTEAIGLDLTHVQTTDRGHVRVNDRLETTAHNIWAFGDCANSPHFTHIAYDDFRIVRDNLAGGQRTTTGRQVPSCLFTDPELARVGLSESEAKHQGIPYRLAKIPMMLVLRTRALGEMRGFLKVLISTTDDKILGFTGLGVGAGDIMSPVQLAMRCGLSYKEIRDMIIPHLTLPEGLNVLLGTVPAK